MENVWKELISKGIISKTRTVGRAELYKLNKQNPTARLLLELDSKLSKEFANSQAPIKAKIPTRK